MPKIPIPSISNVILSSRYSNAIQAGTNAFINYKHPQEASSLRVAVKDNFCTTDFPTTCSSSILSNFQPPYDASVVKLLRQQGVTFVGKTNCDEFGMGSDNQYSHFGRVLNPLPNPQDTPWSSEWQGREQRSPGGSSGGSAVAVASKLCDLALGSDTGGSTRLPAAYCGIYGFKPSYGLLSRWGLVSYADSLDTVGLLARDVELLRWAFDILSKYDKKDPTSIPTKTRNSAKKGLADSPLSSRLKEGKLDGIVVGIPKEYFPQELGQSVVKSFKTLLQDLKSKGATLRSISLPSTPYALSAYYVLASAEASSNLARYDGMQYGSKEVVEESLSSVGEFYAQTRTKHFGQEVKKRILLGCYALRAEAFDNYFLQAQKLRALVQSDFNRVFRISNPLLSKPSSEEGIVDFILHPTSIGPAPLLNSKSTAISSYVQDILTVPASLAGIPALNIPIKNTLEDGLPLGATLVGQWGADSLVLDAAKLLEDLEIAQRYW